MIQRVLFLCGALAIPTYAEEPVVTGMLPVVVTDDVDRLKTFYRDVVGLPYFRVSDAEAAAGRLRKSGAVLVSALVQRPWGDRVAYFLDPDENLIAVADSKH